MAKRNTGELFLAGSPDDNNSDGNFDYKLNGSTRSRYSDGVSIFGKLSACREHHYTNQWRSTAHHRNDLDDSAHRRDDAAGGPSVISIIASAKTLLCVPCESGILRLHPIVPAAKQPLPTHQREGESGCLETKRINNGAVPPHEYSGRLWQGERH